MITTEITYLKNIYKSGIVKKTILKKKNLVKLIIKHTNLVKAR